MKKIKALYEKHKEIIMYLIMGFLTTAINWVIYAVSVKYIGLSTTVSNMAAWVIAVIFAYVTNKILVFESYSWNIKFVVKEFILFISSRIVTGVIEIVGVPFLIENGFCYSIFGIKGMITKVAVSVIVVILNYVFSKLIIFKNKLEKSEQV